MNNFISQLALVAAVSEASTAQAKEFEVSSKTTLSLFGAFDLKYNIADEISDTDGSTESTLGYEDNGSRIGFGALHAFDNGMTGYIEINFEHDANESGCEVLTDKAVAGLIGDFGEVGAGRFGSIYTNAFYDLIDPFETASLGEEGVLEEDNLIAYFIPDFNGITFELQAQVRGNREIDSGSDEAGMDGVVKYSAERWVVHGGIDDRGAEEVQDPITGEWTTEAPVYGLGDVVNLTDPMDLGAGLAFRRTSRAPPMTMTPPSTAPH